MAFTLEAICFLCAAILLGYIGCNPPYDFKEGVKGPKDKLYTDCSYDIKGNSGKRLNRTDKWYLATNGLIYTYIEITNLKPEKDQGTVSKKSGGVGSNEVAFEFVSKKGHGFLFQIKFYGTAPAGTNEPTDTGNCFSP